LLKIDLTTCFVELAVLLGETTVWLNHFDRLILADRIPHTATVCVVAQVVGHPIIPVKHDTVLYASKIVKIANIAKIGQPIRRIDKLSLDGQVTHAKPAPDDALCLHKVADGCKLFWGSRFCQDGVRAVRVL
jgi:hypothetical protein